MAEKEICFRDVKHVDRILLGGVKGDLVLSSGALTFRSRDKEVKIELKRIIKVEKGMFFELFCRYLTKSFSIYLDDGTVERFIARDREEIVRAINEVKQNIAEGPVITSQAKRPIGITILAVLSFLGGVVSFLPLLELLRFWYLIVGLGIFFTNGILGFIFAYLLLIGRGYLILVGFQIAGIILSIVNGVIIGKWSIVIYSSILGLIILYYLTKPHVRLFFGRRRQIISRPMRRCSNCDVKIDLEAKICPLCGFEQPPITIVERKHLKTCKNKKTAIKLLITGVAITLIILAVVFSGVFAMLMSIIHTGRFTYNPQVNITAPSFMLTDINGAVFSLEDFKGKIIILDFFATWCGPCKTQIPYLLQIYEKYGSSRVVIISISIDLASDTVDKLKRYALENNIAWIIARDIDNVARKYEVTAIPTIFIIDQNSTIRYKHVGVTSSSILLGEVEILLG